MKVSHGCREKEVCPPPRMNIWRRGNGGASCSPQTEADNTRDTQRMGWERDAQQGGHEAAPTHQSHNHTLNTDRGRKRKRCHGYIKYSLADTHTQQLSLAQWLPLSLSFYLSSCLFNSSHLACNHPSICWHRVTCLWS